MPSISPINVTEMYKFLKSTDKHALHEGHAKSPGLNLYQGILEEQQGQIAGITYQNLHIEYGLGGNDWPKRQIEQGCGDANTAARIVVRFSPPFERVFDLGNLGRHPLAVFFYFGG